MRFRTLLFATGLVLPAASRAENVSGVYVSLGAGVNFLQDMILAGVRTSRFTGNTTFDPGFVGVAALGWGFGNGLRAEIEGNYRYNKLSRYPGAVTFQGSEQKYGGFVNLLYDFDFGWPVRPSRRRAQTVAGGSLPASAQGTVATKAPLSNKCYVTAVLV